MAKQNKPTLTPAQKAAQQQTAQAAARAKQAANKAAQAAHATQHAGKVALKPTAGLKPIPAHATTTAPVAAPSPVSVHPATTAPTSVQALTATTAPTSVTTPTVTLSPISATTTLTDATITSGSFGETPSPSVTVPIVTSMNTGTVTTQGSVSLAVAEPTTPIDVHVPVEAVPVTLPEVEPPIATSPAEAPSVAQDASEAPQTPPSTPQAPEAANQAAPTTEETPVTSNTDVKGTVAAVGDTAKTQFKVLGQQILSQTVTSLGGIALTASEREILTDAAESFAECTILLPGSTDTDKADLQWRLQAVNAAFGGIEEVKAEQVRDAFTRSASLILRQAMDAALQIALSAVPAGNAVLAAAKFFVGV